MSQIIPDLKVYFHLNDLRIRISQCMIYWEQHNLCLECKSNVSLPDFWIYETVSYFRLFQTRNVIKSISVGVVASVSSSESNLKLLHDIYWISLHYLYNFTIWIKENIIYSYFHSCNCKNSCKSDKYIMLFIQCINGIVKSH